MNFDDFVKLEPYTLEQTRKEELFDDRIFSLTKSHRERCTQYASFLDALGYEEKSNKFKDVPFLPVRAFKEFDLKSVTNESVVKTLTSSGTTGQKVSRIYLDKYTAFNQQKAMTRIVSDFLGNDRIPMIIIDTPNVLKDRQMFSARGAGIVGFSIFAKRKIFALDSDMNLDISGVKRFIEENQNETILLFGFTYMIWQYFYKQLYKLSNEGMIFDLSQGVLIHGGGWKKLSQESVSDLDFKNALKNVCGIKRIHNYYGMVEQTGCIYMECEAGHLHASIFSDVIVRRPKDFRECEIGAPGILQVVSVIPESYPGHSILTEDEGVLLGIDDCECGRKGKYFSILGRLKSAEIRGCSDTFQG